MDAVVGSLPFRALGRPVVRESTLWPQYVFEDGEEEAGRGVSRRDDDDVFGFGHWSRGIHQVAMQTNDIRGLVVILVRFLKPREFGIASIEPPVGMSIADSSEGITVTWGRGSWVRVLRGELLSEALTLAHLLAASDEVLAAALQTPDGAPVFTLHASPAASAREVGDALSPFTVERWSAWLASRG